MRHHPESVTHCYDAEYKVTSIDKDFKVRLLASSPLSALYQLHQLAQNTHHWTPDSYVVTFLKRDGLTPYDLPPATNPDVRPRIGQPVKQETMEMFPGVQFVAKPDTPSVSPPADAPAASTSSPP